MALLPKPKWKCRSLAGARERGNAGTCHGKRWLKINSTFECVVSDVALFRFVRAFNYALRLSLTADAFVTRSISCVIRTWHHGRYPFTHLWFIATISLKEKFEFEVSDHAL
jgi:hypothetical protein